MSSSLFYSSIVHVQSIYFCTNYSSKSAVIIMNFHKNSHHFSLLATVTVILVFLWIGLAPCKVSCELLSVAESKGETSPSEREITSNNNRRLAHLQELQSAGDILNKDENNPRLLEGINFGTSPIYDSLTAHDYSIPEIPEIDFDQINKFVEQREEEGRRIDAVVENSHKFNEAIRNVKIDTRDSSFSFSLSERKRWKVYYLLFASLVLLFCIGCCALCCKDRTSSLSQEFTEMSTAVPLVKIVDDPPQQSQEQLAGVGVDVDCGGNSPLINRNSAATASVRAQEMSLNLEIPGTTSAMDDCNIADKLFSA